MDILKIKPVHPSQGDYVLINAEDFDPAKHELYGQDEPPKTESQDQPTAKRGRKKADK